MLGIVEQLRQIVTKMWAVPQIGQTIGDCEGRVRGCREFANYCDGPFQADEELKKFVIPDSINKH